MDQQEDTPLQKWKYKSESHEHKKKQKEIKPHMMHTLSKEDIELIVNQVNVSTKDILDQVKSTQKKSYEQVTK